MVGLGANDLATIVRLPLRDIEPTHKHLLWHRSNKDNEQYGLRETRLITIVASEPGKPAPPPTTFPRAELVIVREP